jgi:hypothetical protein
MDLRDYPQRGISKIPSFVLIMVGVAVVVTRAARSRGRGDSRPPFNPQSGCVSPPRMRKEDGLEATNAAAAAATVRAGVRGGSGSGDAGVGATLISAHAITRSPISRWRWVTRWPRNTDGRWQRDAEHTQQRGQHSGQATQRSAQRPRHRRAAAGGSGRSGRETACFSGEW